MTARQQALASVAAAPFRRVVFVFTDGTRWSALNPGVLAYYADTLGKEVDRVHVQAYDGNPNEAGRLAVRAP